MALSFGSDYGSPDTGGFSSNVDAGHFSDQHGSTISSGSFNNSDPGSYSMGVSGGGNQTVTSGGHSFGSNDDNDDPVSNGGYGYVGSGGLGFGSVGGSSNQSSEKQLSQAVDKAIKDIGLDKISSNTKLDFGDDIGKLSSSSSLKNSTALTPSSTKLNFDSKFGGSSDGSTFDSPAFSVADSILGSTKLSLPSSVIGGSDTGSSLESTLFDAASKSKSEIGFETSAIDTEIVKELFDSSALNGAELRFPEPTSSEGMATTVLDALNISHDVPLDFGTGLIEGGIDFTPYDEGQVNTLGEFLDYVVEVYPSRALTGFGVEFLIPGIKSIAQAVPGGAIAQTAAQVGLTSLSSAMVFNGIKGTLDELGKALGFDLQHPAPNLSTEQGWEHLIGEVDARLAATMVSTTLWSTVEAAATKALFGFVPQQSMISYITESITSGATMIRAAPIAGLPAAAALTPAGAIAVIAVTAATVATASGSTYDLMNALKTTDWDLPDLADPDARDFVGPGGERPENFDEWQFGDMTQDEYDQLIADLNSDEALEAMREEYEDLFYAKPTEEGLILPPAIDAPTFDEWVKERKVEETLKITEEDVAELAAYLNEISGPKVTSLDIPKGDPGSTPELPDLPKLDTRVEFPELQQPENPGKPDVKPGGPKGPVEDDVPDLIAGLDPVKLNDEPDFVFEDLPSGGSRFPSRQGDNNDSGGNLFKGFESTGFDLDEFVLCRSAIDREDAKVCVEKKLGDGAPDVFSDDYDGLFDSDGQILSAFALEFAINQEIA